MEARASPPYARLLRPEGAAGPARRWALAAAVALAGAAVLGLAASGAAGAARGGGGGEAALRRGGPVLQLAEAKPEGKCSDKFIVPPEPKTATELNGVALADVCFTGAGPHHVFIIGDWGGIKKKGKLAAASHLNHRWNKTEHFQFVWPTDTDAQLLVAKRMAERAPASKPEYILNMGDNFYWGGVNDYCAAKDITEMYSGGGSLEYEKNPTDQFKEIFEEIYKGPGIDGLMWLGVLGNHDWGGWRYDMAWDQAVGYTWSKAKYAKGRWMTPALYYSVKVKYPGFSVDYWFLDTNVWDALPYWEKPPHNICGPHNAGGEKNAQEDEPRSCGKQGGPTSVKTCKKWFEDLWDEQKAWLDRLVPKSTAEWRVVVTHFPPYWGKEDWVYLAKKHELDVIITGHRHSQNMHCAGDYVAKIWAEDVNSHEMNDFLDPTAWVVSGGGGGITSEHKPEPGGNDDQYGFVDMTLTKEELTFEGISHGGKLRKKMVLRHHYAHGGVNKVEASKPQCQVTCAAGNDCTYKPKPRKEGSTGKASAKGDKAEGEKAEGGKAEGGKAEGGKAQAKA